MNVSERISCLSGFQLKCIAILSMALDHTGAVLFPQEIWLRCAGRLAFPHDVYRYMARLGVFALISEIPYDLAFRGVCLEFAYQNVFFTLLIGIVMMKLLSVTRLWPEKAAILILAMWLAVVLRTDYNFRGILLIFMLYVFREQKFLAAAAGGLWNFLYTGTVQRYGVFSAVPMLLYNGKPGRRMKYFFYIFYPAHLLILYGISRITG